MHKEKTTTTVVQPILPVDIWLISLAYLLLFFLMHSSFFQLSCSLLILGRPLLSCPRCCVSSSHEGHPHRTSSMLYKVCQWSSSCLENCEDTPKALFNETTCIKICRNLLQGKISNPKYMISFSFCYLLYPHFLR